MTRLIARLKDSAAAMAAAAALLITLGVQAAYAECATAITYTDAKGVKYFCKFYREESNNCLYSCTSGSGYEESESPDNTEAQ
jgi:hypothetical protein